MFDLFNAFLSISITKVISSKTVCSNEFKQQRKHPEPHQSQKQNLGVFQHKKQTLVVTQNGKGKLLHKFTLYSLKNYFIQNKNNIFLPFLPSLVSLLHIFGSFET